MYDVIGWIGVICGLMVAPAQYIRICRTREVAAISYMTYCALVVCITCYLIHAIDIRDPIFITAQCLNLSVNARIWLILTEYKINGNVRTRLIRWQKEQ